MVGTEEFIFVWGLVFICFSNTLLDVKEKFF